MENKQEDTRAQDCAKGCYEYISELFEKFEKAKGKEQDELETELDESNYGITVVKHYIITLAGGGPAVRIYGEIEDGEPVTAELQYQDWFTPWTEYRGADEELLLNYARHFVFET